MIISKSKCCPLYQLFLSHSLLIMEKDAQGTPIQSPLVFWNLYHRKLDWYSFHKNLNVAFFYLNIWAYFCSSIRSSQRFENRCSHFPLYQEVAISIQQCVEKCGNSKILTNKENRNERGSVIVCVCVSLPFKQHEEDILLGAEVLHRGRPSANLTPKDVVEDLGHIFFTLVITDKAYVTFDKAKLM